jgi:flagellar motor switch protein FliN/FliY
MAEPDDKPIVNHGPSGHDYKSPSPNVEQILDISVPVVVVLAHKDMTVREVLQLVPGTVVQFEKNIKELIELMVNNIAVATGNTVKIGERFGLQVREMAGAPTAIRALGGKRTD